MSTPVSVQVPVRLAVARDTSWIGGLPATVQSLVRALRAEREMRQRARDAAAVRAYAREIEKSMPSMAADLYAAADRHAA